jgi:hypothetical protein
MSYANKTYSSTNVGSQTSARLAQCSSCVATPRSCGRKAETALQRKGLLEQVVSELTANESKSKKYQHKIKPGVIRDCTRTIPEYVWGDEGAINE